MFLAIWAPAYMFALVNRALETCPEATFGVRCHFREEISFPCRWSAIVPASQLRVDRAGAPSYADFTPRWFLLKRGPINIYMYATDHRTEFLKIQGLLEWGFRQ